LIAFVMGCRKPVEAAPDPAPSVAPPPEKAIPWCRNGAPIDPANGDAAVNSAAWLKAVELGTVSAFASEPIARTTTVVGGALSSSELPLDQVNAAICPLLREMSVCMEEARPLWEPAVVGDIKIHFTVTNGVASIRVSEMGKDVAELMPCANRALDGLELKGLANGKAGYLLSVSARREPDIKMIETGTDITGTIAPEVVKRAIRAEFPRLRACYDAALKKDLKANGTIAMKFRINKDGVTENARLDPKQTKIADDEMQKCVVAVFASLRYPITKSGTIDVTYPIDFQTDE
jgi:hypothetical protein